MSLPSVHVVSPLHTEGFMYPPYEGREGMYVCVPLYSVRVQSAPKVRMNKREVTRGFTHH